MILHWMLRSLFNIYSIFMWICSNEMLADESYFDTSEILSMAHIAPESPVLGEALERRAMLLRARNSHTRLLVSLLLALFSLYEANHSVLLRAFVPTPPLLVAWVLYTTEMLLFAVATANLLGSVWTMLAPLHGQPPLALTDRQFSLLKLQPSSPLFTKSPEKKTDSYPNPFTPLPGPLLSPASASSPAISPPNSPQTPANMSSTSWLSTPSTPGKGLTSGLLSNIYSNF